MTPAFIMKFILASSADLCQPDLITIRRGYLRAIKLLSKIQVDACFVGFTSGGRNGWIRNGDETHFHPDTLR